MQFFPSKTRQNFEYRAISHATSLNVAAIFMNIAQYRAISQRFFFKKYNAQDRTKNAQYRGDIHEYRGDIHEYLSEEYRRDIFKKIYNAQYRTMISLANAN